MLECLAELIEHSEEWLMQRILDYAIEHGYSQYTSTLKEPWRLSIRGLSEPLVATLRTGHFDLDPKADDDYRRNAMTEFGALEAQRHRERGIDIQMFLGLFKYYRQAYQDLVETVDFESDDKARCRHFLDRFFDRIEISFCGEWVRVGEQNLIDELQRTNRRITNEKNKYMTLFESLADPVLLLDAELRITNINQAAATLFDIQHNRYYDTRLSTATDTAASRAF